MNTINYDSTIEKNIRRNEGIFYSPDFLIHYIVKEAIDNFLQPIDIEKLKNIKILDPSCGDGAFLVAAFDCLMQIYQNQFPKFPFPAKWIMENNLYGVDLDNVAVELCKKNLLLKSGFICENIKQGNSLVDDESISKRAFIWEKEFPKIVENQGFDVIVGNPPWGATLDKKQKEYLY
jgi:type I restriction-modification system DNA methylase subunit